MIWQAIALLAAIAGANAARAQPAPNPAAADLVERVGGDPALSLWPELLQEWLRGRGLLERKCQS